MQRDYADGVKKDIEFFVGTEVERTPAHGMKTLFVVGIKDPNEIIYLAQNNGCKHIFVGANQCFDPGLQVASGLSLYDAGKAWENMIMPLLDRGFLVTLDFDAKWTEFVSESSYCSHDSFIPQISVKIPYIQQLNYNTMLKIDDKDFKASNPGVWCHSLHDLMDRRVFTPWTEYGKDQPL